MKCQQCHAEMQNRNICACGWVPAAERSKPKTSNCLRCGEVNRTDYLIQGNCHDCHTEQQMDPSDREYYRVLAKAHMASAYRMKPSRAIVDVETHVLAASRVNQRIEDYLDSLPRSREEFNSYFKGKNVTMGGRKIL